MTRISKKKIEAIINAKNAIADFDITEIWSLLTLRLMLFKQWRLPNLVRWRRQLFLLYLLLRHLQITASACRQRQLWLATLKKCPRI